MQSSVELRPSSWPCSERDARPTVAQVPPRTFAARSLLGLLKAYKLLLSPLFSGSCRFHPSCADYSAEAIRTHGATRGVVLTLTRLSKCHPFGRHGFDPVPARPAYDYDDAGRAQCLANRLNAGPRDQVL
jgi:putative membrane protein insertion efficiency factor